MPVRDRRARAAEAGGVDSVSHRYVFEVRASSPSENDVYLDALMKVAEALRFSVEVMGFKDVLAEPPVELVPGPPPGLEIKGLDLVS